MAEDNYVIAACSTRRAGWKFIQADWML